MQDSASTKGEIQQLHEEGSVRARADLGHRVCVESLLRVHTGVGGAELPVKWEHGAADNVGSL